MRRPVSQVIHYPASQIESHQDFGKDKEKKASIKGELKIDKKIKIKITSEHDERSCATTVVRRDVMLEYVGLSQRRQCCNFSKARKPKCKGMRFSRTLHR